MKKVLLGAIIVSSLFGKTNVSLSIGSNNFDNKEGVDSATTLGIRGDFYLDGLYHMDLGYENLGSVDFENGSGDTKVQRVYTQFSADGEEEYHVVPYMGVGVGYEKVSDEIDELKSQPFISLGIGFRYNISNNFNFLLDGRALWKTSTRNINFLTSFGVGYMLDAEPINNQIVKEQEIVIPKHKLEIEPVATSAPKQVNISSVFSKSSSVIPIQNRPNLLPVVQSATVQAPIQKVEQQYTNQSNGTYIQVAAYSKFQPRALLSKLTQSGHKVILRKSGSMKKALIGPYRTKTEALNALKSIKKITRSAFIYKG